MPRNRDPRDAGIYTAEMGQPPDEPDMGSIRPRPPMRNLPGRVAPGTTMKDLMRGRSNPPMKNLPDRLSPGTTMDDLINQKMKPRQDMEITPMKKGGSVSSASKRADGIAQRGKTRGTMVMCGGGYMKGKK